MDNVVTKNSLNKLKIMISIYVIQCLVSMEFTETSSGHTHNFGDLTYNKKASDTLA
jgi:hypothetical protein